MKDSGNSTVFMKKQTLAQLSCMEFCEISNNTFFAEHLWMTASTKRKYFTSVF